MATIPLGGISFVFFRLCEIKEGGGLDCPSDNFGLFDRRPPCLSTCLFATALNQAPSRTCALFFLLFLDLGLARGEWARGVPSSQIKQKRAKKNKNKPNQNTTGGAAASSAVTYVIRGTQREKKKE